MHEAMSLMEELGIDDLAPALLAAPGRMQWLIDLMSACPDLKPLARDLLAFDLDIGHWLLAMTEADDVDPILAAVPAAHMSADLFLLLMSQTNTAFSADAFLALRDNKDVMRRAVEVMPWALHLASARLCDDEELVHFSVDRCRSSIGFASDRLHALMLERSA